MFILQGSDSRAFGFTSKESIVIPILYNSSVVKMFRENVCVCVCVSVCVNVV